MAIQTKNEDPLEERFIGIPGADLVVDGLRELSQGKLGECGLLVLVASPRLRSLGIQVPEWSEGSCPFEHQLYTLLETIYFEDAYSRYNSLLRSVASFLHALEQQCSERLSRGE